MKVLYFAWLRERIGVGQEMIDVPSDVFTAADLVHWLTTRDDRYAAAFADMSAIRVAVDQKQVEIDAPIRNAAEVAFFPPVTGG